jgi:hypothetical protein
LSIRPPTKTTREAEKNEAHIHTAETEFLDVPKSSMNESTYSFTPNVWPGAELNSIRQQARATHRCIVKIQNSREEREREGEKL